MDGFFRSRNCPLSLFAAKIGIQVASIFVGRFRCLRLGVLAVVCINKCRHATKSCSIFSCLVTLWLHSHTTDSICKTWIVNDSGSRFCPHQILNIALDFCLFLFNFSPSLCALQNFFVIRSRQSCSWRNAALKG